MQTWNGVIFDVRDSSLLMKITNTDKISSSKIYSEFGEYSVAFKDFGSTGNAQNCVSNYPSATFSDEVPVIEGRLECNYFGTTYRVNLQMNRIQITFDGGYMEDLKENQDTPYIAVGVAIRFNRLPCPTSPVFLPRLLFQPVHHDFESCIFGLIGRLIPTLGIPFIFRRSMPDRCTPKGVIGIDADRKAIRSEIFSAIGKGRPPPSGKPFIAPFGLVPISHFTLTSPVQVLFHVTGTNAAYLEVVRIILVSHDVDEHDALLLAHLTDMVLLTRLVIVDDMPPPVRHPWL
ncbi:hypothetical protein [Pararhizobium qamdonense]|uniref:hypothetical protein n=1 Tax=Pararhizobium qamdonense TaxID=3031126 RepID=UPI0023E215AD|nr:hypothetical protein [Pararhizobium qamdonense]